MLAVIGAHAAGWPRGGFAGVDVFFVISGFVITGSLLREQREAARISLARFYARRARRLMPAAIVTIAAVVGVGFALYPRIRAEEVFADGVASMLFASSFGVAVAQSTHQLVSNAYTLARSADGRDLSASDLVAAEAAEAATYGMAGRVTFVAAPPEGAPLGNCYTRIGSPYACATSIPQTWKDIQSATEQIAVAQGERVIDSRPFTCWDEICPAFAGTLPIRYDQTHLTVEYSEHIAPYLWRWLTANGVLAP